MRQKALYPTPRIVFDRKKIAAANKEGAVQIEIRCDGSRYFINTGVRVYKGQINASGSVVGRGDSAALNKRISAIMQRINGVIAECAATGAPFSLDLLSDFRKGKSSGSSFLDFMDERIKSRNLKESTRRCHRCAARALRKFGEIKNFEDLTPQKIKLFDDWIARQGEYRQTTIHGYHKRIKAYINEAVSVGLVSVNPYSSVRISRGVPKGRKFLTEEEFEAVRTAKMSGDLIEKARDLFVFCCYTGLAVADLKKFDWKNVQETGGRYVIRDQRQKSDMTFFLQIMAPAVEILKKYDYKLPYTAKYNERLKVVAAYAGVRPLSTHMARHTFATWALSHGAPIEHVSKMLGHTNIQTTQIYAKILQKDVFATFDALEKEIAKDKKAPNG